MNGSSTRPLRWSCRLGLLAAASCASEAPPGTSAPFAPAHVATQASPAAVQVSAVRDLGATGVLSPEAAGGFRHSGRGFEASSDHGARLSVHASPDAALRLRTAALGRQPVRAAAAAAQGDCVGFELSAGVREEHCARAAGIEQRWLFDARPVADGDLTLEVEVGEAAWLRSGTEGHRFAAQDGSEFVYGPAIWVGADGTRTSLPVVWQEPRLRIDVPGAVLASSAYPAVLDPVVSVARDTDAGKVGPASGREVAVAHNGSHYLTVWSDHRYGDLFSARIANDGTNLTPVGQRLRWGYAPALASDGSGFFMAHNGPPSGGQYDFRDAYVTWLDADGKLKGSRSLHQGDAYYGGYSVARMPSGYAVAFGDRYYAQVFLVADANHATTHQYSRYYAEHVSVAPSSDGVLLAYSGGDSSSGTPTLHLEWLGSDLTLLESRDLGVADPISIALASRNGKSWLLYSVHDSSTYYYDLFGRVVNTDRTLGPAIKLATNAWQADIELGDSFDSRAIVSFTSGFVQQSNVRATYVEPSGDSFSVGSVQDVVTAAEGQSASSLARQPGASTGFVAWQDRRGTSYGVSVEQVYGTLLGGSGAPSPAGGVPISAVHEQSAAEIVFGDPGYLVAWNEAGSGFDDVWASVLDEAGVPTAEPVAIAGGDAPQYVQSVVSSPGSYAVVYDEFGSLYARYLTKTGALVGSGPSLIAGRAAGGIATGSAAAAFAGDRLIVAWHQDNDVYAAALDGAGALVSGPHLIAGGDDYQTVADLAAGHGGLLLSYTEGWDRNVVMLDANGALSGTPSTVVTASGTNYYSSARVVAGSTGFLATYADSYRLYSKPLSATGSGLGAAVQVVQGTYMFARGLAFDGRNFLIAWSQDTGVRGARLRENGTLLEAFDVSLSADDNYPAIAADVQGTAVVAYEGYVPSLLQDRVRLRTVSWKRQGEACTTANACHSTFCTDGVCCNEACSGGIDCRACSLNAGAAQDGVCGAVQAGKVCRPASQPCDVADVCDGSSVVCPNAFVPSGTVCRAAAGACDVADVCNGTNGSCTDVLVAAGTTCRAAETECDVAEACTGWQAACPADATDPLGTACAAGAGICAGKECAVCRDVVVPADASCQACASVLEAPLSSAWAVTASPGCEYPLGDSLVELTVTSQSSTSGSASCNGVVSVVDTAPPVPSCNAASELAANAAPVTFTATVSDNCSASVVVSEPVCTRVIGDRTMVIRCPPYEASGANLTLQAAPARLRFEWTATATDGSGNTASTPCAVTIVAN